VIVKMKILKWIVILIIPVAVLFSFTMFFAFGNGIYLKHIEEENLSTRIDLLESEIPSAVSHITSYIKGAKDDFSFIGIDKTGESIQIFSQREIDHMKDVRVLFDYLKWTTMIGLLIVILFLKLLKNDSKGIMKLADVFYKSGVLSIIISMLVSVLVVTNFSKYFTKFHEVLFTNDLWLLDPKTDVLIQILPITFFINITMKILLFTMGTMFFITALGMVIKEYKKSIGNDYSTE